MKVCLFVDRRYKNIVTVFKAKRATEHNILFFCFGVSFYM